MISSSGLDIGCHRGSPVSVYVAPFEFTGTLAEVVVGGDQALNADKVRRSEMARQ